MHTWLYILSVHLGIKSDMLAPNSNIFILLQISILQQSLILLPKVLLSKRWLSSLGCTCRFRPSYLLIDHLAFAFNGLLSLLDCLACHLIHSGQILQITIDKVRQQAREEVREWQFLITIWVHSSHYGIDVRIRDEILLRFTPSYGLRPSYWSQYSFDLLAGESSSVAHVKGLIQLSYLQVKCLLASLFSMEFGYLSLDFLHYLDLAFK